MNMEYPWRDEELLREKYINECKSTREISEEWGCDKTTVLDWLHRHGIGVRDKNAPRKYHELDDEGLLYGLYVEEGLTANEIADKYNTDPSTVTRYLKRNNIEITNGHIEKLRNESWLREQYKDKERSLVDIAEGLDCDDKTVLNWTQRHGIKTRHAGHASLPGEENPNWRGGERPQRDYGKNWETQRQKALKRDGYECRACGMPQEEHLETFGKGLDVHHVIPLAEFEDPEAANDIGNLVTACKSCHRTFEHLPIFPIKE